MRKHLLVLGIIYIFLAIYGGVPYYHQDQDWLVKVALQTIPQKGYTHFFYYPSLIVYLNTICYGVLFCLLRLMGMVHTPPDFALLYEGGKLPFFQISFFFVGHLITVAFGMIGVASTYLITYKLTSNKNISFIASLFLCTSLLWISNSHFVTVDIALSSLSVVFAYLVLDVSEKEVVPRKRELMIIGIVLGLIASTKYNGGIVVLPLLLSFVFIYRHFLRRMIVDIVFLAGISLFVFLLTNPFILIDFNQFRGVFLHQIIHGKIGHYGYTTMDGIVYHVTHTLPTGYGIIALLFSIFGIVWLVKSEAKIGSKIFLLSFCVSNYFLVAVTKYSFQRYVLPLVPILAIFSGLGLWSCVGFVREMRCKAFFRMGTFTVWLAVGIVAFQNVSSGLKHDVILSHTDTREEFLHIWNEAKVNQDANVFIGHSLQSILKRKNWSYHNSSGAVIPVDLTQKRWDLIIFDSFSHDRILYEENIEYWKDLFIQDPSPLKVPGANQWNSPLLIRPYRNYEELHVLQISPFSVEKERIPFSPQSVYASYPPDLWYRKNPGSFIEVYTANDEIFRNLVKACQSSRVAWSVKKGSDCYYLKKLSERYRDLQ